MIKEIKKGIMVALSFSLTLGLIGVTYAAWVNITTVSTGETLTAATLNDIINNQKDLDTRVSGTSIPTGAVIAFNLASCPTGWSAADGTSGNPDLRGEFIRGLDNGRGVDTGRTLASAQNDNFKSHSHEYIKSDTRLAAYQGGGTGNPYFSSTPGTPTSNTGGTETRPRNIALLYCVKD